MSSPSPRQRLRLSFNSPVVLTFAGICIAVQILNLLTSGASNRLWFSVERAPLGSLRTWARLVLHVFGHADWDHLLSNMMYLLILGPMLEEKYGSDVMIFLMLATAFVTGLAAFVFAPGVAMCGASGVVFAMILLSSFTEFQEHTIPVTVILVAALYAGSQIYSAMTSGGGVAYGAHFVGGAVGAVIGCAANRCGKTA